MSARVFYADQPFANMQRANEIVWRQLLNQLQTVLIYYKSLNEDGCCLICGRGIEADRRQEGFHTCEVCVKL